MSSLICILNDTDVSKVRVSIKTMYLKPESPLLKTNAIIKIRLKESMACLMLYIIQSFQVPFLTNRHRCQVKISFIICLSCAVPTNSKWWLEQLMTVNI